MIEILASHPESLILAAVGGFFMNMMNLYEDSRRPKNQRTTKDALYWLFFLFWPLAGAVIASLYMLSQTELKGFSAFLAGLTAPSFIQSLMAKTLHPPSVRAVSADEEEE